MYRSGFMVHGMTNKQLATILFLGGKAFPGNTFTLLTKDGIPVVWEGFHP